MTEPGGPLPSNASMITSLARSAIASIKSKPEVPPSMSSTVAGSGFSESSSIAHADAFIAEQDVADADDGGRPRKRGREGGTRRSGQPARFSFHFHG